MADLNKESSESTKEIYEAHAKSSLINPFNLETCDTNDSKHLRFEKMICLTESASHDHKLISDLLYQIFQIVKENDKQHGTQLEFFRCRLRYPEIYESKCAKILHFEWSSYG